MRLLGIDLRRGLPPQARRADGAPADEDPVEREASRGGGEAHEA